MSMETEEGGLAGKRRRQSGREGESSQGGEGDSSQSQRCDERVRQGHGSGAVSKKKKMKDGLENDEEHALCTVCCSSAAGSDRLICAVCTMLHHGG